MKTLVTRFASALTVLLLGVGAAMVLPGSPRTAQAAPDLLASGTIADVAERVVDSVVNISTTREVNFGPMGFDPFFSDPRSPFFVEPEQRKAPSLGSGVIITAQGRILTNSHVVSGADDIKVTIADGTELDAKVVGVDPRSDLAVIQLQGTFPALKPLKLGDSARLRLGEVVIAVGNPFGVGQAVTMGIVSAKGRASVGIVDYEDFIQTDAAINPGNSGGALINLQGELVGINTAILSRSGGYQGIGFAIPTNMAVPIMDMLVKNGKVSRGYLGVDISAIDRDLADEYKLSTTHGVFIGGVQPDGPAARAGLREGDVVIAVDGSEVRSPGQLRNVVAMTPVGKTVTLDLYRGKNRMQVKTTVGELPEKSAKRPAQRLRRRR
jgi:Do/DeqQ family serine protease